VYKISARKRKKRRIKEKAEKAIVVLPLQMAATAGA